MGPGSAAGARGAEGGHLTKPSPQAPLARRTEPPRQDRRLSLPMNAGTRRGLLVRASKRTRRFRPRVTVPNFFRRAPRNTQPTAASALWQSGTSTFSAGRVLARRATRPIDQGTWTRSFCAKRPKPKSTKFAFREIATAPQNGFPNGPTSRVAVESGTCPGRGTFPACLGASGTLDVWPEPLFDLVVFRPNSSRVYTPHGRGREGEPSRYTPAKRPRSLKPAAGHPRDRREGGAAVGLASPAARSTKFAFREIATAPQNGFPNGPTSRVAVESGTCPGRGAFPPAAATGHPGCLARAPFRLSRFFRPRNSSAAGHPRDRREGGAAVGLASPAARVRAHPAMPRWCGRS
ncbi:hypothetical protein G5714_024566 [Onychostoma macrolepis]|uniref:Uncharacterized protein n=1 Tax=Onychostoma macrolepis TaxID=369639 RepID=A0A7J6BKA9_9TELE|nr:hypothetical protein G5714_024566 [Onychostoma macrolepis]